MPVDNVSALADALARLLADPPYARRLAAAARQFVVRHHDIERVWPLYYESILQAGAAAGRWPAQPGAPTSP